MGYVLCQNSQSSGFDNVTPFNPEPQLLQAITHIYLAYIVTGCYISPEIQNR